MAEAMTNREIEDVLTSIRRLVAQDGARPTDAGRLILTEELRVGVASVATAVATPAHVSTQAPGIAQDAARSPGDGDEGSGENPPNLSLPEPDFGKLEATIAELEAAVSASGETWEAEASPGDAPVSSNVTDLYGRLNFVHRSAATEKDADVATSTEIATPDTGATEGAPGIGAELHAKAADSDGETQPEDAFAAVDAPALARDFDDGSEAREADARETGDAVSEHDSILDEEMLRALVAQIVREELHGQLGERVTQQVRKLVRAEIAKALDDRNFL
ncbi:hypothetical protein [Pararhodobacter sp.]|uniref:hypothetical protein n=1 Tax=Pararhodobacter sp. TaxID=2127056 RepID=UPI002AFDDD95|nr:hypothetical protein [Pararhodobacter sp.]